MISKVWGLSYCTVKANKMLLICALVLIVLLYQLRQTNIEMKELYALKNVATSSETNCNAVQK